MLLRKLFKLFLWKNWLFMRYNKCALLTIFAAAAGLILLYLKTTYKVTTAPRAFVESKNTVTLLQNFYPANNDDFLLYAPKSVFIDELMEKVRQQLQLSAENVKSFENNNDMKQFLEQKCKANCFGVQFDSFPDAPTNATNENFQFSISSTVIRISPKKRYVNDEEVASVKDNDDYMRTGFFTLQHVIDRAYIAQRTSKYQSYDIQIESIPNIEKEVIDSQRIILFGSLFAILFNVLLLSTFLVPLVEEKQDGIKEFLITATPLNFLNGMTFFLLRLVYYIFFVILVLFFAWLYRALGIAPIGYVIVLFVLYVLSAMSYAYLVSVCFHSVFYAKVGGLLLLVIPYVFHVVSGNISIVATYFFSTKTFMEGLSNLQIFTNKYRILSFEDLAEHITDASFSLGAVYMLFIVQIGIYTLLYYYLSSVFPGPGGLKKPYLFFLQRSFYKKQHRNEYTTNERGTDAIIIGDLVKKFKTPCREIVIADRINMAIKNKQITVLLGHNGAGKTTTLNMIMGSVPKDSGKIIVCSERDVSSYRHLIGFCPQHSVFMNYMTCIQHLQFFAQLRGMSQKDVLVEDLLRRLKLEDKANVYGHCLSGGMKRRLSLGIAVAGQTKVIVLDEPSSGLDIESRRELWDLLLELRKTKTILVTTHYMEEAEVLGDTIAILADGQLKLHGTPLELKRKHGNGYILKLSALSNDFRAEEVEKIISIVKEKCDDAAEILNHNPPTLLISLPYAYKNKYHVILYELEMKSLDLGIRTISISDSSLEEVFLNCAAKFDQVDSPDSVQTLKIKQPYQKLHFPADVSWCQQFGAVAYKKFIYLRSEWIFTLLMLLVPVLSIAAAILLMNTTSLETSDDVLPLKLSSIKGGIIYTRVNIPNEINQKVEKILNKEIESYKKYEYRKLELQGDNTVIDELLALQHENLAQFLQHVIGVIEIVTDNDDNLIFHTYFSYNIYHSSVILLNLIDNTMLKYHEASEDQDRIDTNYAPIRRYITDVSPTRLEFYAVIVPIGMFFCMFFYSSLPFKEHISGFKTLQPLKPLAYWSAVFLFDIMIHFLICLLLCLFQCWLMPKEFYATDETIDIMIVIFFYGFSYLPILYFFANAFRSISTIATYLLFMLIISAVTPLITSGNISAMIAYETTIFILSILPDFNLNHQLRIINERFILSRQSKMPLSASSEEVLSNERFFGFVFIVFTLITLLFIYVWEKKEKREALKNLFSCYSCRGSMLPSKKLPQIEDEYNLVSKEEKTVDEIVKDKCEDNYPLVVHDLSKYYDGKSAVCGLSFAVKRQECFGLLGVNGAGKTSTFQMITANITITGGTVKIDGVDILENEAEYKQLFGYCPQYDCLNDFMTSSQMLAYMARLRGLTGNNLQEEVAYWLEKLDLLKYRNSEIRHYSGGTKRKLSAAVAMIGNPSLVLLDEPTTGVDPVSRRFLWKCIKNIQQQDKTIVLTSHSMDECEQLCNRLAIMADGNFKCIGDVPYLKERFGSGFTIKIKLKKPENLNIINKKLPRHFQQCNLRENHADMATYFIPNTKYKMSWSEIFKRIENFSAENNDLIEDYSVNESTLEDIFLRFDTKNKYSRLISVESAQPHDNNIV